MIQKTIFTIKLLAAITAKSLRKRNSLHDLGRQERRFVPFAGGQCFRVIIGA
jgi:hypothetical protein